MSLPYLLIVSLSLFLSLFVFLCLCLSLYIFMSYSLHNHIPTFFSFLSPSFCFSLFFSVAACFSFPCLYLFIYQLIHHAWPPFSLRLSAFSVHLFLTCFPCMCFSVSDSLSLSPSLLLSVFLSPSPFSLLLHRVQPVLELYPTRCQALTS